MSSFREASKDHWTSNTSVEHINKADEGAVPMAWQFRYVTGEGPAPYWTDCDQAIFNLLGAEYYAGRVETRTLFTHPQAQAAQAIQIGVNRYIVACPTTALAAQPRAPDEDEDKDITGGIDAHLAQPAQSVDVEKDASRYRWLRISACEIAWNEWCSYAPGYTADGPEELDAAIDAALTEKGNG